MENNNNKKIEELSVEELMKVAQQKIKSPKKTDKKMETIEKIKLFIVSENIKSHSNIAVPNVVVYDRFYRWCDVNDMTPLKFRVFTNEFNKLFKKVTRNHVVHYLLVPDGFAVNDYETLKGKYAAKSRG